MMIDASRKSQGVGDAVVDIVGVGWLGLGVEGCWDRVAAEFADDGGGGTGESESNEREDKNDDTGGETHDCDLLLT